MTKSKNQTQIKETTPESLDGTKTNALVTDDSVTTSDKNDTKEPDGSLDAEQLNVDHKDEPAQTASVNTTTVEELSGFDLLNEIDKREIPAPVKREDKNTPEDADEVAEMVKAVKAKQVNP